MSKRVYFYEVFSEEKASLEKHLPPEWEVGFTSQAVQESGHAAPPADVISIRTQSVLPPAWGAILKAVLSRSAGFDHLQRFCETTGTSAGTGHLFRYSGRAVAEHAAMMWISLMRRYPAQARAVHSFSRDNLTGRECAGKIVAVFGVGDIGFHTAQIAEALGMTVLGVDIVQRHDGIQYVSPEEGLARADIVVCAMNLTRENHGYFTAERLRTCRDGLIFINIARGEFARSTDILALLDEKKLGAAGLDVFYDESVIAPALREHRRIEHPEWAAFQKLSSRDDVMLTPHNAFNTAESLERKSVQTVMQLKHFFEHGKFFDQTIPE